MWEEIRGVGIYKVALQDNSRKVGGCGLRCLILDNPKFEALRRVSNQMLDMEGSSTDATFSVGCLLAREMLVPREIANYQSDNRYLDWEN